MYVKPAFYTMQKEMIFAQKKIFENMVGGGEILANKLDIYYTTAESHIDNEYDLMLRQKAEALRDMYL